MNLPLPPTNASTLPFGPCLRTLAGRALPLLTALVLAAPSPAAETGGGKPDADRATISIQGNFPVGGGEKPPEPPLIYSLNQSTKSLIRTNGVQQVHTLQLSLLQGKFEELVLELSGGGEVTQATGKGLGEWGFREPGKNRRQLVLRASEKIQAPTNLTFTVQSRIEFDKLPTALNLPVLAAGQAALFNGMVEVSAGPGVKAVLVQTSGVQALQTSEEGPLTTEPGKRPLRFQYTGGTHALSFKAEDLDPDARIVRFTDFKLEGEIRQDTVSFTLSGQARVRHPEGGTLDLLSGAVALTDFSRQAGLDLRLVNGQYRLELDQAGTFPVQVRFDARVSRGEVWNEIVFTPVASPLRPVAIHGLPESTQVEFLEAAIARKNQAAFQSHLPSSGPLQLRWQPARPEVEGRLFHAVTGTIQMEVSPGLVRQLHLLEYKVMQGEMREIAVDLAGEGEVTRVQGEDILNWKVDPATEARPRRLMVQLNQARKTDYTLEVQTQAPLEGFPRDFKPLRLVPIDAIRYGGHVQVINAGAVRLEIREAPGLAQISPQRFPRSKELAARGFLAQNQVFAFRFSSSDYDLTLQADNILPEIAVSEVLVYRMGETESLIDAELELEIREAPLREFRLEIPEGYSVSRLNAPQLADYSVTVNSRTGNTELRLQFGKPLIGRQVVTVRLAHSHDAPPPVWTLPPVRPLEHRSLRGFLGLAADPGLRLKPGNIQGLSEIATALFPQTMTDLQLAYRVREANWQAAAETERVALSVQVDSLQLFSIGEGIVYGSTLLNYFITGAPVSSLKVASPANYQNLEFVGSNVRNWSRTDGGYTVTFHSPVSGTYSLLATYDMQFDPRGGRLSFEGLTPLDVQSEQGHVVVVSAYQFEQKATEVSPNLISLKPGEIPSEYQLLFDTPILGAWQFTTRPFQAALELKPLAQEETVHQVIDRALLSTKVSREGQVLTEATYYLKTRGASHLRVALPPGAQLWSMKVQDKSVVPVQSQDAVLIPLPPNAATNAVVPVELKLTTRSATETQVPIELPAVQAPVLLAQWHIEPDAEYELGFSRGTVRPAQEVRPRTGLIWLQRMMAGQVNQRERSLAMLALYSVILAVGMGLWARKATRAGYRRMALAGWAVTGLAWVVGLGCLGLVTLHTFGASIAPQNAGLDFTLPTQTAGQVVSVELSNRPVDALAITVLPAWPALLGVILALAARLRLTGNRRLLGTALGWALVMWGVLQLPSGAGIFFGLVFLYLAARILLPTAAWFYLNRPQWQAKSQARASTAGGTAALLLLLTPLASPAATKGKSQAPPEPASRPASIEQQAVVEADRVRIQGRLHWQAKEGEFIDLLTGSIVLTRIQYPTDALQLTQVQVGKAGAQRLTATTDGRFEVAFEYQLPLVKKGNEHGFSLPTPSGLINQVRLQVDRPDLEIVSPDIVTARSIGKESDAASHFDLALAAKDHAWVAWKPRGRNVRTEKAVFYAELTQLFLPAAGVVEGAHEIRIRPAQGRVQELNVQTPENLTITDVQGKDLSGWWFDPAANRLRIRFEPPQAGPFQVNLLSQVTTGLLPFKAQLGVVQVEGAASQVGLVGIATGPDVQLDQVDPRSLSVINLEDFRLPGLLPLIPEGEAPTLRRAFRYTNPEAGIDIAAAAVEPDIRAVAAQTLSLGEDRSILAANLSVNIARAGVFKLSFSLPQDLDVETVSGPSLSHWTELKSETERVVTLHLKGKTLGQQTFAVTLSGPGVPEGKGWTVPRLMLREADKQTGQLVVVPEQGLRLQVASREGLTQVDPKEAGLKQPGVLAFRLLQSEWQLSLDLQKVDAWISVLTLQDVSIREGLFKISGEMDYTIENSGLKSLHVLVPAGAGSVRFAGEQIADTIQGPTTTNGFVEWEIKLHRRVIGSYALQVSYQVSTPDQPEQVALSGFNPARVDLQRGYLVLRTERRMQVTVPDLPSALQAMDWHSLPNSLRRASGTAESQYAFRIMDPDFTLPLAIVRHQAAEVLPARIEKTDLLSVLSPEGSLTTRVTLAMQVGDKRLLKLQLPQGGRFWFAFVNNVSVAPWKEGNDILLPLEAPAEPGQSTRVEFLYSMAPSPNSGEVFDFDLSGPRLDLPLQNITWQVHLPPNHRLENWDSRFHLASEGLITPEELQDIRSYTESEQQRQVEVTRQAEDLLQLGNGFLAKGRPDEARKAFQSAWSLSQHDAAFNEDARVQLNNLKMQQAVVGLNFRRLNNPAEGQQAEQAAAQLLDVSEPNQAPRYTQEQVKQALDQNRAEDNATLMRLAEHLVEHQGGAQPSPLTIRATLPEIGRRLTFTRSLQVDARDNMHIQLETEREDASGEAHPIAALLLLFVVVAGLGRLTRFEKSQTEGE